MNHYSPSRCNQQEDAYSYSSNNMQVSPRKELQGPRPAPLMVKKDSRHSIKKPPAGPTQRPVIIYLRSPKIIHTKPQDFMALVQRLTGRSPTKSPSSAPSSSLMSPLPSAGGKPGTTSSSCFPSLSTLPEREPVAGVGLDIPRQILGMDLEPYLSDHLILDARPPEMLHQTGILSPAPSSLPPPPQNLFVPSPKQLASPNLLELNPLLYARHNSLQDNVILSPLQRSLYVSSGPTPPPPMNFNSTNSSSCLVVENLADLYRIQ